MRKLLLSLCLLLLSTGLAHAFLMGGGPASISGSLGITDFATDRIFQRVGTTKTITFAGTYSGNPDAIDVQVIDASNNAVIIDWTRLSSSSISGGVWSGTLSVSQKDGWYKWKAKIEGVGVPSIVSSANQFGVGALILMTGQSNMANYWGYVASPGVSNANTRRYAGNGWFPPSDASHTGENGFNAGDPPGGTQGGDGAVAFANELHTLLGVNVGLLEYAIGATSSAQWAQGGTYYNNTFNSSGSTPHGMLYGDVGGDAELDVHAQGESDAECPCWDSAGYNTNIASFFTGLKANTRSSIAMAWQLLGRSTRDALRNANFGQARYDQLAFIAANGPNMFFASSAMDGEIDSGGIHNVPSDYVRWSKRVTQSYGKYLSLVSYGSDGPKITSVHWASGTPTKLTVNISPTATFLLQDGAGGTSGTSLNGFRVFDNGVAQTISSTAFAGSPINSVVLTLSAPLSSGDVTGNLVTMDYEFGYNPHGDFGGPPSLPSYAKYVFDTSAPNGDTLGLPMQPTNGLLTVVTP